MHFPEDFWGTRIGVIKEEEREFNIINIYVLASTVKKYLLSSKHCIINTTNKYCVTNCFELDSISIVI